MKTFISFIIIFNIMVFVHEFGHFFFAKRHGIRVHEFALGMGPAILKKQVGETLYALRALPIGGFVKLEGEDGDSEDPNSFSQKSAWQRFQVLVAGSLNNILLAFLAIFLVHVIVGNGIFTTTIDQVTPDSPAAMAGVQAGDKIEKIDDQKVSVYFESSMLIDQSGDELKLEVSRAGERIEYTLKPKLDSETNRRLIGVQYKNERGIGQIAKFTVQELGFFARTVFDFFGKAIRGRASMEEVAGPVGLVRIVGDTANTGSTFGQQVLNLMMLMGMLSLNLGIINLLPIPALDGGRLLFIIIELFRGKPVPKEREAMVHAIGMIMLLALIGYVTFHDIIKLL